MFSLDDKETAYKMAVARLERLSQLGRKAAKTGMSQAGEVDFSRLLERCEEIDFFLESRCLDFGLEIIGNTLSLLVSDFAAVAGGLAANLVGLRDGDATSDFGQALILCEEILEEERPTLH
jgi:hypothetical protein